MRKHLSTQVIIWCAVIAVVLVAAAGVAATQSLRERVVHLFAGEEEPQRVLDEKKEPVDLIKGADGMPGLKLTDEAVKGLAITPVKSKPAVEPRALPPQNGTINFDTDRMFPIRSRFNGELVEMKMVPDLQNPSPGKERMVKWGDKVKQDDVIAVVWSVNLGTAKAALVDAICSLKLSEDVLNRQYKLFQDGATSIALLNQAKRQVQADKNSVNTAERTLLIWRLDDEEIKKIKEEAARIGDMVLENKDNRNAAEEAKKWARVEVKVPIYAKDPTRELVVVEKNTSLGDMVDPGKDPPLFRVADMSRLQIWVHPPEEYLPMLKETLKKGPGQWFIQFQTDPPGTKPAAMEFVQIAPSLEPNQHTPMVIGYLNNPDGNRFVVGQFVNATLLVPPEPDCVEIPTEALNEIAGQSLIFVQPDPAKHEFIQRRVSIVHRFKDKCVVRTKLTKEDEDLSKDEVAHGRLPILPLRPDELVVTRGIIELTARLETELASGAETKK
jgi:multidrug efflux pump subunit AcrA (membrane-fusion protein)